MEQKIKHLIRIADTDLDGTKQIYLALRRIKGIGFAFSNMVCALAGIRKKRIAGSLTDAEISKINEIIAAPFAFGAPEWMLNRRRDFETGTSNHLIGSELDFSRENDIKMMKIIKSYKGVRHGMGLPVRGQRTKSNFRKSKSKGGGAIGVIKSKAAKATAAEKGGKK